MTVAHLHEPPPDDYEPPDPHYNPPPVPSDPAAEQAVIGALLLDPTRVIPEISRTLAPQDFWQERHELIYRAATALHGRGELVDIITVTRELTRTGDIARAGGPAYLHRLISVDNLPTASNAAVHAEAVSEYAAARRADALGRRVVQAANGGIALLRERAEQIREWAQDFLDETPSGPYTAAHARPVDQFLAAAEEEHYDWLLPGLLERQDRVILTAEEGAGKSTLLRQIATQAAAGIHPFTYELTTPTRVLLLDLENHERQTRRELRPLYVRAGDMLDPEHLRVECRTQGLDLSNEQDREWLTQLVTDARPDMIVTGPIYKMADGDPNDEKFAKPVALFLDQIRVKHDCALWLEAHVGNESQGAKRRPERPFGWSGWRRWPEFGIYLSKDGDLTHWRGQRDASREWPSMLMRGGEWPWSPARSDSELVWQRIRECVIDAGEMLTNREIGRRLNISASTIDRTTRAYSQHFAALKARYTIDDEE